MKDVFFQIVTLGVFLFPPFVYSDSSADTFCKSHPSASSPGEFRTTAVGFECKLKVKKRIKTHLMANRMCTDLSPWNVKKYYKKGDSIPYPVECIYEHPYFCVEGALIHDQCFQFTSPNYGDNMQCQPGFEPMHMYIGSAVHFLSKMIDNTMIWVNISADNEMVDRRKPIFGTSDPKESSGKVILMLRRDDVRGWKAGDMFEASKNLANSVACWKPASRMPAGPLPYGASVQEQYHRGLSRHMIQPVVLNGPRIDTMNFHESCQIVGESSAFIPTDANSLNTVKSVGNAPIYIPMRKNKHDVSLLTSLNSKVTVRLRDLGVFGVQQRIPKSNDIRVKTGLWRSDAPTNLVADWPRAAGILLNGKVVDVSVAARYPVFCVHEIIKVDGAASSERNCPKGASFDESARRCQCDNKEALSIVKENSEWLNGLICPTCHQIKHTMCLMMLIDSSGSMGGPGYPNGGWNTAMRVVEYIMDNVPDTTVWSMGSYNQDFHSLYTKLRKDQRHVLKNVPYSGGYTNMYAGIDGAGDMLKELGCSKRNYLFIIGDGDGGVDPKSRMDLVRQKINDLYVVMIFVGSPQYLDNYRAMSDDFNLSATFSYSKLQQIAKKMLMTMCQAEL